MIAFLRKNLTFSILNHTIPHVSCRTTPVSFSLSLHFFSTWRETQPGINPAVFDLLVHRHDFPPELASRVVSKLTCPENPEKADSVLSFFKESGFSSAQLVKIVKYRPRFLSANVEDSIEPKIKIFQGLGFSSDTICKLISTNPSILHLNVNDNIIPSLAVMKGLFGSNAAVARALRNSSRFLTAKLENNLVPNLEFLKSCGVPMEHIRIVLGIQPNSFLIKPEVMRRCAEKAKEMGLNASSKNFIYAISTIAKMSNEAWELKLQAFRDLGFSDTDILTMFSKGPHVFYGSMDKITKVTELLLATGKFDRPSIVNDPSSLGCSIEKRLRPRLRILGTLESRNLIKKWPSLGTTRSLSDEKFFDRFIRPYSNEVSNFCITKNSSRAKKEMKTC